MHSGRFVFTGESLAASLPGLSQRPASNSPAGTVTFTDALPEKFGKVTWLPSVWFLVLVVVLLPRARVPALSRTRDEGRRRGRKNKALRRCPKGTMAKCPIADF